MSPFYHNTRASRYVTTNETSDIDAIELFKELKMFCLLIESISSTNKNFIKKLIYNKQLQEILLQYYDKFKNRSYNSGYCRVG